MYFNGILMILSLLYCILLLTLLYCKFVIGGNYSLFGVKFFRLKFGWCKESDILHVCSSFQISILEPEEEMDLIGLSGEEKGG